MTKLAPILEASAVHDRRMLSVWLTATFSAGMVNTITFLACQRFVTHVTGHLTLIGKDIHQVVLVGGPASMYLEAFRSLAHKVPVEVVEEPRFANVRGFQLIGEREMLIETA